MAKNTASNRADRVVNYELDRTTRRRESPTPRLERLSVAVVVDGARELTADGDLKIRDRSAEEVEQYRTIIAKAMGFDENRGDQLEVAFVPFVRPAYVKEKPVEPLKILGQEPQTLGILGGIAGLVLFGLWMAWSIRKKRRAEAAEAARLAELYGEEEDAFPAEPSVGEKVEDARRRAADATRHDVLPTANVIRGWLTPDLDAI